MKKKKINSCISVLPQPKHNVQHSHFVWIDFLFFFLLFIYCGVGTFTLSSWHRGICVVQENNRYSM